MWLGVISILSLLTGNLEGVMHHRYDFNTEQACMEYIVPDTAKMQLAIDAGPNNGKIKLISRCVRTTTEDSF